MIVKVLASSSEANAVYISNSTYAVMVDMGLKARQAPDILNAQGINPADLKAIFITHEHSDHVQGLGIANKYKIPVVAPEQTLDYIENKIGKPIKLDKTTKLSMPRSGGVSWGIGTKDHMTVRCFPVHHDAIDPVGYIIESGKHKVSVMMDTGRVTDDMIRAMAGSTIYVFECNHDTDLLVNGSYAPAVKARVGGDNGHLSNAAAAYALSQLVKGQGEQIYLSHLSTNNNAPARALRAVKLALTRKGIKNFNVEVV